MNEGLSWALFENSPFPCCLVSRDGRFIDCNHKWVELTGYTKAELLTMTFSDITEPENIYSDIEESRRLSEKRYRSSYSMDKTYIRKDGKKIKFKLIVNSVLKEGNFLYFVSFALPIKENGIFMRTYFCLFVILLQIINIIISIFGNFNKM